MAVAHLKVLPALGYHPPALKAELILAALALDLIEPVLTAEADFPALRTLGISVLLVVANRNLVLSHCLLNIIEHPRLLGTYLVSLFPTGPKVASPPEVIIAIYLLFADPAEVDFATAASHLIASVDLRDAVPALGTLLGTLLKVEFGEGLGHRSQLVGQ